MGGKSGQHAVFSSHKAPIAIVPESEMSRIKEEQLSDFNPLLVVVNFLCSEDLFSSTCIDLLHWHSIY